MALAIKIENLSKAYQLGEIGTGTLSRDLERWWARVRGKEDPFLKVGETNDRAVKGNSDVVWSLRDVDLDVEEGSALGIIGRNGAGKSTLLKILSRVTSPTTGLVKARGRIASLLEVGTGFHPELTGRENIFLNGAILGMRKAEITRKFDEIVEFAGVERYVDTPVKRYSSGMYVRLAFAVAAYLECEIVVVDEVLAVGDAEFQKRCLGKMRDVSRNEGRTVLFVSHNMAAIQSLCTHAIRLEQGQTRGIESVDSCIAGYLQSATALSKSELKIRKDRSGTGVLRFHAIELRNTAGQPVKMVVTGQDVILVLSVERSTQMPMRNVLIAVGIDDESGNRITHFNNETTGDVLAEIPNGLGEIEIRVTKIPLMPGRYDLTLYAALNGEVSDWIQNAFSFTVEAGDYFETGRLIPRGQGSFLVDHRYSIRASQDGKTR